MVDSDYHPYVIYLHSNLQSHNMDISFINDLIVFSNINACITYSDVTLYVKDSNKKAEITQRL